MKRGDEKKIESNLADEGEIQTIHEMITEALMGTSTSSSSTPLDSGYTNASFTTDRINSDQTSQMYMNNGGETLTLGKLYFQFKNLDLRLSRVEEVILKRDDIVGNSAVKKRATTHEGSNYPDPCFGADQGASPSSQLTNITTINPILTSSNDLLSLTGYQSTSAYSIPSVSSLSKSTKIHKKDDIKRSELDHFCLPLLEVNPKPTTEQLQDIVTTLSPIYPNVNSKQLLSKVREWFRKRREYMSQRIFQVCSEIFKDVQIETEAELEFKMAELNQNEEIINHVLMAADLEITDESVAKDYCNEKILTYINGLYRPPTMKNRSL